MFPFIIVELVYLEKSFREEWRKDEQTKSYLCHYLAGFCPHLRD